MSYYVMHDDEEELEPTTAGEDDGLVIDMCGQAETRLYDKIEAPLEECPLKISLEFRGADGVNGGRLGVDLVTILDISASMRGFKIAKMKLAMKFLIHKLCPMDRLSVVTFNKNAEKLCPLRQITDISKTEITEQVDNLVACSSTKMDAGLKLALRILKDRTVTKMRRAAIMLISSGTEDGMSDAARVPMDEVPVYTFGFGSNCEPEVLRAIAENSNGGIFTSVSDLETFDVAFSASLADLLKVSLEDLTLTIKPIKGIEISEAYAEHYQQVLGSDFSAECSKKPGTYETLEDIADKDLTVIFGSLYDRETRKVHAKLILPEVPTRCVVQIYSLDLRYRLPGNDRVETDYRIMHITRTPMTDSYVRKEYEKELSCIPWESFRSNASPEEERGLEISESYDDRVARLYKLLHTAEPAEEDAEVVEERGGRDKNYNFIGYEFLGEAVKAKKWEKAHKWLKGNRREINNIFTKRNSGKEISFLTKKALRNDQHEFAEEILKLAPPKH